MILPQSLLHRWKKEGVTLLPPYWPQSTRDAFTRMGSVASKEVVEFYSEIGGTDPMDDGFLKIWSVAEIEAGYKEPSEYGPIFADYLISCWSFRLKPVDATTSAVYVDHHRAGEPLEMVAGSLAEFLAIYERDPKAAHAW